jgi:formylmethanofuran dehydrogenase subunit C
MTTLTLKTQPSAPLEADCITPDNFLGKSSVEIAGLPVVCGNETTQLGDFFSVEGDGDSEVTVEGDLARVKHIGAGMAQGQITVHGNVGMHLGAAMRGGRIVVYGSAGDWAGAEMRGGQLHIHGDAGHVLGAAYRGGRRGMTRGLIVVDGNAGNEVGSVLRRGVIVVGGDTGDVTGAFMIAGSILVLGHLGERAGTGMKRGSIIARHEPKLLPTFRYACTYRPVFLRMLLIELRSLGAPIEQEWIDGRYRRYSGDLTALGKGEILTLEGLT